MTIHQRQISYFRRDPMNRHLKLNVFVVDDDPDDLLLVKMAFEKANANARLMFFNEGRKFLSFLDQWVQNRIEHADENPSVILLDLNMPKMDGHEILRIIREHVMLRSLPVVVLTTSQAEEDIEKAYLAGASGYVVKPVSFDDFVSKVKVINEYWSKVVTQPRPST